MNVNPTSNDSFYRCTYQAGLPIVDTIDRVGSWNEDFISLTGREDKDSFKTNISHYSITHSHSDRSRNQRLLNTMDAIEKEMVAVQWDIEQYQLKRSSLNLSQESNLVFILTKEIAKDKTYLFILQERFKNLLHTL